MPFTSKASKGHKVGHKKTVKASAPAAIARHKPGHSSHNPKGIQHKKAKKGK